MYLLDPSKRLSSKGNLHKATGFTLVELLVVIAIIGVLAGVILSAGSVVLKMAKRTKALNTANQIQTASLAYYTEYSVYPIPTDATPGVDYLIPDTAAGAADWKALLYGLCGNINPYDVSNTAPANAVANTRAINFLNLKNTDVDAAGGPINPMATGTSIYFNIAFDGDYDNIIGDSGNALGKVLNFSTGSATTYYGAAAGPTGGIVLWANCNGASSANPNFWVHTY